MIDKKIHPTVIKKLEELGFSMTNKAGNYWINKNNVFFYADFRKKKTGDFYGYNPDEQKAIPASVVHDCKEIKELKKTIKNLDIIMAEWHQVKYEVKKPTEKKPCYQIRRYGETEWHNVFPEKPHCSCKGFKICKQSKADLCVHLKILKKKLNIEVADLKKQIPSNEKAVSKLTEKQILEILPDSELRDRKQIVKEILGEKPTEYIHDFQVKTPEGMKRVITISYDGIREAAKRFFDEWDVVDHWVETLDDRYNARARVTVKMKWYDRNKKLKTKKWTTIGSATEKKSDPEDPTEQFDYRIALSKAIRNATRHLIPKELLDEILEDYKLEADKDANKDTSDGT
jgi:hypothetical protein